MQQYLVKGGISKIQDFIFNIPTKGAAKQLKARSFYVQVLGELAVRLITDSVRVCEVVYNSGGNFYLIVEAENFEENFAGISKQLEEALQYEEVSMFLVFDTYNAAQEEANFVRKTHTLNQRLAKQQLQKFKSLAEAFEPFLSPSQERHWGHFGRNLAQSKGFRIVEASKEGIEAQQIAKFGYALQLLDHVNQDNKKHYCFNLPKAQNNRWIVLDLPKNEEGTLEFGELAEKAAGAKKLGILKMDVDNLGAYFRKLKTKTDYTVFSQKLVHFFEGKIHELLTKEAFRNMIYPIFSGGDDVFLIGVWERIFDFVSVLQQEFAETFATEIEQSRLDSTDKALGISAALVVVDSSFPVVQFADLAEHDLDKAKQAGKNRLTVFGEVFTWEEFGLIVQLKNLFIRMVEDGKEQNSKGLLRNILQLCKTMKETLAKAQKADQKQIDMNSISQFVYLLRDFRKSFAEELKTLYFDIVFSNLLQTNFSLAQYNLLERSKQKMPIQNTMLFFVAARWAELESRKTEKVLESIYF